MSLDKAIEHNKEFRKPYVGSKAFDRTCRNHGSCTWCQWRRMYNTLKTEEHSKYDLEHYLDDE